MSFDRAERQQKDKEAVAKQQRFLAAHLMRAIATMNDLNRASSEDVVATILPKLSDLEWQSIRELRAILDKLVTPV